MALLYSIIAFQFLRAIHNIKQSIVWLFTGIAFQVWRCHNRLLPFAESAQLLDVRYHAHRSPPSMRNFITTHNAFVSPRYIRRPNVSLYCFERHRVVFIEWVHTTQLPSGKSPALLSTAASKKTHLTLPKYGKRRAARLIVMSEATYHELEDLHEDNANTVRRVIYNAHKAYEPEKSTCVF
jgi:hypothetical protein